MNPSHSNAHPLSGSYDRIYAAPPIAVARSAPAPAPDGYKPNGVPIYAPRPTSHKKPDVLNPRHALKLPNVPIPNYPPERAKDLVRERRSDGRPVGFTGETYHVPLPADVDPKWWLPLSEGKMWGIALSRVGKSWTLEMMEMARSLLERSVRDANVASPAAGLYVSAGWLPNQPQVRPSRPSATRAGVRTNADLLVELLLKQRDWYDYLYATPTPLRTGVDNEVWRAWANNPRDDCVHVVAVRRTLPDRDGRMHYLPQLVLCPKA